MKKRFVKIFLLILLMCLFSVISVYAYNTGDDYPEKYKKASKDALVDEWNFYNRECTSFTAWCLNSRNDIPFTNQYMGASRWGNAMYWGTVAQSLGIKVDRNPTVGSVAWWNTGKYGHVAWVKAVNGDSITIDEYNHVVIGGYSERTISASSVTGGFIHIKDIEMHVDLGTNFYALILQRQNWIPITIDDDKFVRLHTEIGKSNQLWKFVRQDDGSYLILSALNGKALELYNGITYDGNPVAVHDEDWGGNYQRWFIYSQSNGYVIMSKHYKDYELVLDLRHDVKEDGGEVITYRRNNSDVQIWGIYKEDDVQLGRPTLTVDVGTTIVATNFEWSNVYGETGYNLRIFDTSTNEEVNSQWGLTDTSAKVVLPAGNYKAYVDSYHYFDFKGGNDVYFTVKDATFNVTFNANGGSVSTADKTVIYNSTYGDLPIPSRTGYTFKGWYTSADGGTQITSTSNVSITSAQILYAQWVANTYKVSFNANGGTTPLSSKDVTYNSTYDILPTPTKAGYNFEGWYTEENEGMKITSETVVNVTYDITLYAHWKSAIPCTKSVVTKSGITHTVETELRNLITPCEILVAGYKNDKLVILKTIPYSEEKISCVLIGNIDQIKVMVWKSFPTLKPLCNPEKIPYTKWITG